ncbi:MAG: hypothetical protein H0T46_11740 [Deltaproteobacteria bacterium]|nr:hypothetical protein [Deltaproteobacteria bacterium]
MSRNLHPSEGARFLLERTADSGASATYKVSIYTPDAVASTTAALADDGTAKLAGATGAPGDLDDRLLNIAKLVARDAPKRREDGLVVWPARILRWRK